MYHVPCPSVICYGQWHHARHHTSSQTLHGYNGARLVESFRAALDTRPHPQLDINWIDMENPNTIMLPRRFVKLIECLRWSWWPSKTLSRDGRSIAVFTSSRSRTRESAISSGRTCCCEPLPSPTDSRSRRTIYWPAYCSRSSQPTMVLKSATAIVTASGRMFVCLAVKLVESCLCLDQGMFVGHIGGQQRVIAIIHTLLLFHRTPTQ